MLDILRNLLPFGISWIVIVIAIAALGGLGYFAFNVLAIQKFLGEVGKLLGELFNILLPKKWDSAKTLIWLSIFSWVMSMWVRPVLQSAIAFMGWIFLIAGVHWVMHEEKKLKNLLTVFSVFLGPWITGWLICYFLFATPDYIPQIAFVLWPPISAIIAGLPRFISSDGTYQTPIWQLPGAGDRQYLVNLALLNLVMSCWIQLTFTTQNWLAEYPSFITDDLSNSAFVVNTQANTEIKSRGVDILNRAEVQLKANLQGQSWSQVERWLLNFEPNLEQIETTVLVDLPPARENSYWAIAGRILAGEYNVQLFATWQGPASDPAGYYYAKTCQISQVVPADVAGKPGAIASTIPAVGNAKVECGPVEGPEKGQPEAKSAIN